MNVPEPLILSPDRIIAYHTTQAQGDGTSRPGLVFLGGFKSDMTGTKALWLEDWAQARGLAYLRFDYRGHGASSGAFEDHVVGDWADDAAEAIRHLTSGPQILIGSSMGGWIALLLARRMPERVAALVGIASAPDFVTRSARERLTSEQWDRMMADGRVEVPSAYGDAPYVYTRALFEDGQRHLVMTEPLRLACPVRLLHGTADADVDASISARLLDHMDCDDARLTLVKGAEHRFSEPGDLALLGRTLEELLA